MDTKYPLEKMEAAFDLIIEYNEDSGSEGHWKDPITARIPLASAIEFTYDMFAEAVTFYTATEATIGFDSLTEMVEVRAVGYRMGPAGP